jgi:hypothetical protein
MKASDLVVSLRHPASQKIGTVINVRTDRDGRPACEISWEDGTVSAVWQCDVEILVEKNHE